MPKTFSVAWFVLLGALPMLTMIGLYSKVVYSLWIKDEARVSESQQVTKIQRIELIPYQAFLQMSLLKASL